MATPASATGMSVHSRERGAARTRRPMVSKLTPVLHVEAIEPVLPFWEALGFRRTVEVPAGDRLGFVILASEAVEVMYGTWAWLAEDMPALAARASRAERSFLFLEVRDVAAVEAALPHGERFLERRETFYGAIEIGLREPGGHCVVFAQFKRSG